MLTQRAAWSVRVITEKGRGVNDQSEFLAAKYGIPVSIAILAVAVRMLFSADRWTLLGIARALAVGALVGFLAILWVVDLPDLSTGQKGVVVGVCATLAEDIVIGLLALGKKLREDPGAIFDMISKWRK